MPNPHVYLSLRQVEQHLGLARGGAAKYRLPQPDVIVGPVNADGTLPRGTVRGWRLQTIDDWNATRPGHGGRPPGRTTSRDVDT